MHAIDPDGVFLELVGDIEPGLCPAACALPAARIRYRNEDAQPGRPEVALRICRSPMEVARHGAEVSAQLVPL